MSAGSGSITEIKCPGCGRRAQCSNCGSIFIIPSRADNEAVIQSDIAAILRALGHGDHARPVSAHAVIQDEIIPAIERLQMLLGRAHSRSPN